MMIILMMILAVIWKLYDVMITSTWQKSSKRQIHLHRIQMQVLALPWNDDERDNDDDTTNDDDVDDDDDNDHLHCAAVKQVPAAPKEVVHSEFGKWT